MTLAAKKAASDTRISIFRKPDDLIDGYRITFSGRVKFSGELRGPKESWYSRTTAPETL